ncbi:MAG: hypothetical protein AAGF77_02670 [Bacteroidota bacterium]
MVSTLLQNERFPNDSGPIYMETMPGRFPVEPFNTFSNFIFVVILIYWGIRVYKNPKKHLFLAFVLPIIFISFIGGTVYHGTRSAEVWLLLDWVPIILLGLLTAVYFICLVVNPWWQRLLFIIGLLGVSFLLRTIPMPASMRISLGYVITALTILLPLVLYLIRIKGKNIFWAMGAFVIFGLAVFFRSIDLNQTVLPMGTHWLWHFFDGVAVHLLIGFIFKDNLLLLTADKVADDD